MNGFGGITILIVRTRSTTNQLQYSGIFRLRTDTYSCFLNIFAPTPRLHWRTSRRWRNGSHFDEHSPVAPANRFGVSSKERRPGHSSGIAGRNRRRRRLLSTTDTLENDMAALAMTGESSSPKKGYSTPAAMGIPITL